ncbi:MAG: arsenosugar biosynthesis radical SAM protein ArsS, partial [Flavobacteriales bacterium]|nr:arsenosugar biosynthesis radical SAM protein ArsS [Flavobacteriales bacterium]
LPLTGAHTLDITGGAPEMHPDFRWLVETAHQSGIREIIVRSNLTILVANKKYSDLPEFFAKHNVRVVSSLPYFSPDRTDRQRGNGVFDKSMAAMRMLNETGYGMPGSSLIFDLVYNPGGAFLPTDQLGLERAFRHHLLKDYQVHFHHLLALTNLPVSRFLEYLIASDNFEDYMDLLIRSFNPATIHGLMCRNTISIAWDGTIYDCDFNQMLKLQPIGKKFHLSNFDIQAWQSRDIALSGHCYGCTAGAGSSCQGATV